MIIKSFAQDGTSCRVTFRLTASAQSAALLGDFNLWSPAAHPLERAEDGSLGVTVALEPGDYRFRYLVDGERWINDDGADGLAPNLFGSADSIVAIAVAPVEAVSAPAVAAKPKKARPAAKKPAVKPAPKAATKPAPRAARSKKPAKPLV
jgi:1,4-alpha-glucan branching enzyme